MSRCGVKTVVVSIICTSLFSGIGQSPFSAHVHPYLQVAGHDVKCNKLGSTDGGQRSQPSILQLLKFFTFTVAATSIG